MSKDVLAAKAYIEANLAGCAVELILSEETGVLAPDGHVRYAAGLLDVPREEQLRIARGLVYQAALRKAMVPPSRVVSTAP